MVLRTCSQCSIRFYAPRDSRQQVCCRCERSGRLEAYHVADRLLAEVFPDGLPLDPQR